MHRHWQAHPAWSGAPRALRPHDSFPERHSGLHGGPKRLKRICRTYRQMDRGRGVPTKGGCEVRERNGGRRDAWGWTHSTGEHECGAFFRATRSVMVRGLEGWLRGGVRPVVSFVESRRRWRLEGVVRATRAAADAAVKGGRDAYSSGMRGREGFKRQCTCLRALTFRTFRCERSFW